MSNAATICLTALSIGPLTLDGRGWKFGRRHFAFGTVAELIAVGLAKREGNMVRMAT